MHTSTKPSSSNLLENLRRFQFQKNRDSSQEGSSEFGRKSSSPPTVLHTMSDSESDNTQDSRGTNQDSVNSGGNENSNSNSKDQLQIIYHEISDSEDEIKNSATNSRTGSVMTVSSSDSEEEKSESAPKVYSRIKSLSSFKFKKDNGEIKKLNGVVNNSHSSPASVKRKGSSLENAKSKKKKRKASDSDDDCCGYADEVVYESDDDSDVEISDNMTDSQQKVFEFLNSATSVELLQIPSCTQNKVNAILEARPFAGWKDLVIKCKTERHLPTSLLNSALDVLKTRQIVSSLMEKCLKIAIRTESCISAGAMTVKEQPSIITPELQLKGYQMVGLNWLVVMHNQNLSGILADEMGLGKTIQVIAFLAYLKQTGNTTGPHLIIAPATTIENWSIEFSRWCPELRTVIYHGSPDERRALRVLWFKQKFKEMDVIITTYSIVSSTYEEKKMFRIVSLQYVVFDEAHMLKNMNTQRYYNLFNINAEHRILLTGTPLQNNLLELMSLLNFVMPNMFAQRIQYIKSFFSKNAKVPTENLPDFEQEQVNLAKRIMKPFVLRRLKEDVLRDLPEKTSEVIACPMSTAQKAKYELLMEQLKDLASETTGDYNYMSSFMQMRKLANHPLAMRFHYVDDQLEDIAGRLSRDTTFKTNNEDHVLEDLSYMSDHDIHKLTLNHKCIAKYSLDDSLFLDSGKFEKLDELLPKLKSEGHRVIIFSQFVFMLDILEEYMNIREHTCLRLDGSTRSLDRQDLIDNYNEDTSIFVFLLTTRAGGVGINLTTADTVIIHDIDFNPYNDKQAEDRCHRLGQTKPVHVIRLVCEGTVEETIYSKAKGKLYLEKELTAGVASKNGLEDTEETKNVELLLKEILGLEK